MWRHALVVVRIVILVRLQADLQPRWSQFLCQRVGTSIRRGGVYGAFETVLVWICIGVVMVFRLLEIGKKSIVTPAFVAD